MAKDLSQSLKIQMDDSQFNFADNIQPPPEKTKRSGTTTEIVKKPKPKIKATDASREPRLQSNARIEKVERAKLTTHIRHDLAKKLERERLQRTIDGVLPNEKQEICDQALELWFAKYSILAG